MYYSVNLSGFPDVIKYYTVNRRTIWEIAEKEDLLLYIRDGHCRIQLDGEEYDLKPNDLFFIPAYHSYKRMPVEEEYCTIEYLHFSSNEILSSDAASIQKLIQQEKILLEQQLLSGETRLLKSSRIFLSNHCSGIDPQKIEENLKNIRFLSKSKQMTCYLLSSIHLSSLLVLMSQAVIDSLVNNNALPEHSTVPNNLKKAISYILKYYRQKITLDELSDYCFVSKQQLIRYFKSAFHMTPISYINHYRIQKAKELLFYSPALSVKEISEELGFDNAHYFSRMFMQYEKETPSAYRNRVLHYHDGNKPRPESRG